MESTVNPNEIFTYNAIRFSDGETWMIYSQPKATKKQIVDHWRLNGGSVLVDHHYPGLEFGTVTATNQQYQDKLTTGMKDFFTPKAK